MYETREYIVKIITRVAVISILAYGAILIMNEVFPHGGTVLLIGALGSILKR